MFLTREGDLQAYTDRMRALLTIIAAAAIVVASSTATAHARPPPHAKITLGVGMGGAKVGQATTALTSSGTIGPAPFSAWGRVQGGFCFEGSECGWTVKGGGSVSIGRHPTKLHVLVVTAAARGWRTSKDVGPGASVATFRRRYEDAVAMTTCSIGSFGARIRGYRVGMHNFFATRSGKVDAIHVSLSKIVPASSSPGC